MHRIKLPWNSLGLLAVLLVLVLFFSLASEYFFTGVTFRTLANQIPTLTVMADFMGVVGGYFYSVWILDIDKYQYIHNSKQFVGGFDLFSGIFKSLFFGAAIAMVSCYRGFNCKPGAEGVGRASTAAFVYSFVLILTLDLFLGIVLDSIYRSIWPRGASLF